MVVTPVIRGMEAGGSGVRVVQAPGDLITSKNYS